MAGLGVVTVGQVLWFVPTFQRNRREVTVVKVGRKWVHLRAVDGLMDPLTGEVVKAGYGPVGRCWSSKAEYDTQTTSVREWSDFYRALRGIPVTRPSGVSSADIRAVRSLLKMS